MKICVEFYGVARQRAGVSKTCVEFAADAATLGDVLSRLVGCFPALANECIDGGKLAAGYTVSIGGERFVRDPRTAVRDAECLLLLSADAGG